MSSWNFVSSRLEFGHISAGIFIDIELNDQTENISSRIIEPFQLERFNTPAGSATCFVWEAENVTGVDSQPRLNGKVVPSRI